MAQTGFGIIGCGNIGPVHAEAIKLAKSARLIAVGDVVEASAKRLADRYGVAAYGNLDEMLQNEQIQAISLCVPSGLRAELIEKCARAGKHVLSEKPLDVTTKRIDKALKAVEKAGVTLGCIFQSRFSDDALQIRKALDQGRFGKLVLGDAYIKWYRSQAYYDSGAWRGTWKLDGGGCLMNQGIHNIDLLMWFMGPVKRVQARMGLVAHENIEVEDVAVAMIEFENGALGTIEGSTATWPGHPARVEVHGTEGGAVLEDGALRFWQFGKRRAIDNKIEAQINQESALGSGAGDPLAALKVEGHRRQIEDFAKAVRDGREPAIMGREGRRAVELIEAIYKSAKSGKAVSL